MDTAERLKKITEEIDKLKGLEDGEKGEKGEFDEATYGLLTMRLMNTHQEHAKLISQVRNQRVDVVQKLMDHLDNDGN